MMKGKLDYIVSVPPIAQSIEQYRTPNNESEKDQWKEDPQPTPMEEHHVAGEEDPDQKRCLFCKKRQEQVIN